MFEAARVAVLYASDAVPFSLSDPSTGMYKSVPAEDEDVARELVLRGVRRRTPGLRAKDDPL